jgi:transcriptional regulator with PAS, ATPase and Fis domain
LFEAIRLYEKMDLSVRRMELSHRYNEMVETHVETSVGEGTVECLVTQDPVFRRVVGVARSLARADSVVLIEGETGTGKELIARILHSASERAEEPFVPVNCGALPQQLLESELFGHRRGAFTGADCDRIGLLESAGEGTIFLDEIDKASRELQVRLLRIIEDRRVRPVGADGFRRFGARILCASNQKLQELAPRGAFLVDLYFRLSAFSLTIPPLRERRGDIPLIARHFLEQFSGSFGQDQYELSAEAEAKLLAYDWPGNVRELRNVMEASAFYARETGLVTPAELPEHVRYLHRPPDDSLASRINELQRREILAAMEKAKGVKTEAAKILGCSRKGLRERMRRLGLEG